jgi:hypothetical protein
VRGKGEHGMTGACLYRSQPTPLPSLDACNPNSFCFVWTATYIHFAASGVTPRATQTTGNFCKQTFKLGGRGGRMGDIIQASVPL